MTTYFDRVLWIEKSEKDEEIKKRLTLIVDKYVGDSETITLYEETSTHIGVPRMWGLKNKAWLLDEYDIVDRTVFKEKIWPDLKLEKYRAGQKEAIDKIFNVLASGKNGGLLDAYTGSGKSLMGTRVASLLHTGALVLVHKTNLAYEWHKTCEKFFPGSRVGHVQADEWNYRNKHLVTATVQTLYSRRDEIPADFWSNFGLVILEESHRFSARTLEAVTRMSPSKFRLGVSATWRRKDKLECIWHWHIGDFLHKLKVGMETGEYLQIPWKTNLSDRMFTTYSGVSLAKWTTAISKNVPYNQWLAEQAVNSVQAKRRTLILTDRIEQAMELRQRILKLGKCTVGLYVGAIPVEGKKSRKTLSNKELEEAKENDIIVGSYQKLMEGVDLPEFDTLYLATPRADVEQAVGRVTRFDKDKKSILVIDPVFQTSYQKNLAKKRLKIYRKLGFKEQC